MNTASPDRIRQDRRLISKTLLKLALPRLMIRGAVLMVAIIIWLMIASWLLDFGSRLKFDQFQEFGQQALDLFAQINPFLWWAVVVVWSLIVFFITRSWLLSDVATGRATPVSGAELSALTKQLSPEVIDVLRWVWGGREEPFTRGDLRQVNHELRHNRINRIDLVREQSRIIDEPSASPAPSGLKMQPINRATSADHAPTVSKHRIEPNL